MRTRIESSTALVEELKGDGRLDEDLRCRVASDLTGWADLAPTAITGLACPELDAASN
jgi:hypothetical protein